MPAERREDRAGVQRERAHALLAGELVEVHGEEHVGGLGLPVGLPLVVAALEPRVVPPEVREVVAGRRHADDAGARRRSPARAG